MSAMPLKAEVKQDIGNHECGRTIGTVAASGSIQTFASRFGAALRECLNQRTNSNYKWLVKLWI